MKNYVIVENNEIKRKVKEDLVTIDKYEEIAMNSF